MAMKTSSPLKISNPNNGSSDGCLGGKVSGPFTGLGNPNFGKNDKLGGKVATTLKITNPNN